jgi:dihydropteroate synthase
VSLGGTLDRGLRDLIPRAEPGRRTRLLGILNVTPDSFHDGGIDASADDSAERARRMVDEGADALDLGGESSRPGALDVPEARELDRVLPVLERVVGLGVPVSIDTVKSGVAREALRRGATIVNDISAGTHDPAMLGACAEAGAGVILMHMRGRPREMQALAEYDDVVEETKRFLAERAEAAVRAGIAASRILLDPGLGFAKTAEHNLAILAGLSEYADLGFPIVVGASRKSFLSRYSDGAGATDRLEATLAVSSAAVLAGARVLRVHDVRANRRAVAAVEAILEARKEAR